MSSHLNPTKFKMPPSRNKQLAACKRTALSSFLEPQEEELAREVLADVQRNGQLLRQISTLDEKIELMQKSIAQLAADYQCVDELQENSGQYNNLSQEKVGKDFMEQKDLRERLLPRLQNIKALSQSITTTELLGLDCKLQAQSTTSREIPPPTHPAQPSHPFSNRDSPAAGNGELD